MRSNNLLPYGSIWKRDLTRQVMRIQHGNSHPAAKSNDRLAKLVSSNGYSTNIPPTPPIETRTTLPSARYIRAR